MTELLYLIGETLITEIQEIEDIAYPKTETPDRFNIVLKDGKRYELTIKENV